MDKTMMNCEHAGSVRDVLLTAFALGLAAAAGIMIARDYLRGEGGRAGEKPMQTASAGSANLAMSSSEDGR